MTVPEYNPTRMVEAGLDLIEQMKEVRDDIHSMFVADSILMDKLRLAQKIAHCESVIEQVVYDIQYEWARKKSIEENRVPNYDGEDS